jgi:hypothetical protein
MVKIVEFTQSDNLELPFNVVEDAIVFMKNDPIFYRKEYYPAIVRIADSYRNKKHIDAMECLGPMVERGLGQYCNKFNIAKLPDEVFHNDDRETIVNMIYSEEMDQIKNGEYK